jgi:uncharacterized protein (DUF488 family)
MNTLYTLGYGSMAQSQVVQAVQARGAMVVDTRYSPFSRLAEWRRGVLEKALGAQYAWVQALGNANYKGALGEDAGIVIYLPDEGVKYVTRRLLEREVILMCACKDLHSCHRLVAAELVREACGCDVVHLRESDLQEWAGGQRRMF